MAHEITDRHEGCLLGGACGDALGASVEFLSLDEIKEKFGPEGIRDMAEAHGKVGAVTDDTQMLLFTASGLLRAVTRCNVRGDCHVPSIVYYAYQRWLATQGGGVNRGPSPPTWLEFLPELWQVRAPGKACITALGSGRMGTLHEPINDSKGCGGVMRIAPVGILVREDLAFSLGCEIAAITHGHPTGCLAAGAMALLVRRLMEGDTLDQALDAVCAVLMAQPQGGETLAALENARNMAGNDPDTPESVEKLGQGWVAEEALAIAVFCALKAGEDFEKGIVLAVNHGGDSDSTGSITGNILGVMLGARAIPERWLADVELRQAITEMAHDLRTEFRDDEEWFARYPPS